MLLDEPAVADMRETKCRGASQRSEGDELPVVEAGRRHGPLIKSKIHPLQHEPLYSFLYSFYSM